MKQKAPLPLPLDPYLDQIVKDGQNHSTLLIKASPGSGKTTRLPWALAQHSVKKVLVLEPRRLAAKLAAQRIAFEQTLDLGKDVGYHFRFEKNLSKDTRLIFYTEGTFLRSLIHNPDLHDVEYIILDEFHERHLETDLALAAVRSIQKRRPDLKIVLMSATLDTKIFEYFTEPKLIEIEAPRFPVELHYLANVPSILNQKLEVKIKQALEQLPPEGDVLVFVPGMREMLQAQSYLGDVFGDVDLLHGDLSKEEQERTLGSSNQRKIILATNIAESSVTIPGIKFVIDSGIQREAHYSPWSGLKSLVDRPITQSSAIQRAGRAGRTSPGICHRLYSEQDFKEREPHTLPEILKADLTDTTILAAELKQSLDWFTPPPSERWIKAQQLCFKMGAMDAQGGLTVIGQELSRYPLDARLSRVLLAGEKLDQPNKKALLRFLVQDIEQDRSGTLWNRLQSFLKIEGGEKHWEKALLTGFVDQVAKYRSKQHDFIHYSGKTIKAHPSLKDLQDGFYLIFDVTQRQEALLVLAIDEEWLYSLEPFPFQEEDVVEVKETAHLKRLLKLGSLILEETPLKASWRDLPRATQVKILTLTQTPFHKRFQEWKAQDFYARYQYWAKLKNQNLSSIEDSLSMEDFLEEWGQLSFEALASYFQQRIESKLELQGIEEDLPTKIHLGGRRELPIHYSEGMDPFVEAPIQDFYGQKTTPTILRGKVPLTLKLLGPHKRPIQVTKDLVGFWFRTYPGMKKEYQREYPRHYWPDDPANAKPVLLKKQVIP